MLQSLPLGVTNPCKLPGDPDTTESMFQGAGRAVRGSQVVAWEESLAKHWKVPWGAVSSRPSANKLCRNVVPLLLASSVRAS